MKSAGALRGPHRTTYCTLDTILAYQYPQITYRSEKFQQGAIPGTGRCLDGTVGGIALKLCQSMRNGANDEPETFHSGLFTAGKIDDDALSPNAADGPGDDGPGRDPVTFCAHDLRKTGKITFDHQARGLRGHVSEGKARPSR